MSMQNIALLVPGHKKSRGLTAPALILSSCCFGVPTGSLLPPAKPPVTRNVGGLPCPFLLLAASIDEVDAGDDEGRADQEQRTYHLAQEQRPQEDSDERDEEHVGRDPARLARPDQPEPEYPG